MRKVNAHTVKSRAARIARFLGLLLALAVSGASAQSLWSLSGERSAASVEIMSSSFITGPDQSVSSYVFVLSAVGMPSSRIRLVTEVPIGHARTSNSCYGLYCNNYAPPSESYTAIGNPFLGVRFLFGDNPLSYLEVGGRPPLAKEEDDGFMEYGTAADIDRLGWFGSHVLTSHIAFNYGKKTDQGFILAMRVGPMLAVTTGCYGGGALNLQYGGRIGLDNGKVHVGAGVTGILGMTTGVSEASEATVHTFAFRFGVRTTSVSPSLMLRVPLDQDAAWGGYYRYTVSIGLTAPIETKG